MSVKIHVGEALETLRTLPSDSVNMILSSPPYYGLRDYGTATWEGGDPACEHTGSDRWYTEQTASLSSTEAFFEAGQANAERLKKGRWREKGVCTKCGAIHADDQIGLERTPEEFVAALVDVFREAQRVLRDDGVAFINIGDSYARDIGKGQHKPGDSGKQNYIITDGGGRAASGVRLASEMKGSSDGKVGRHDRAAVRNGGAGLKAKDLIGIPWMLAFALRADGWYLRQEIIWHKPNPMPESVTDRCTKAHEHVFLLSKSQRYFWNADAIAEPSIYAGQTVILGDKSLSKAQADGNALPRSGNGNADSVTVKDTRNKRDVWTIATEPSSIAHYAMMPTELARTCILAGCPVGGTVLDPFGGAGTTGLVADRLQRNAVLIELSPEHAATARNRLSGEMGMFAEVS
jgi:DNA modification methylase